MKITKFYCIRNLYPGHRGYYRATEVKDSRPEPRLAFEGFRNCQGASNGGQTDGFNLIGPINDMIWRPRNYMSRGWLFTLLIICGTFAHIAALASGKEQLPDTTRSLKVLLRQSLATALGGLAVKCHYIGIGIEHVSRTRSWCQRCAWPQLSPFRASWIWSLLWSGNKCARGKFGETISAYGTLTLVRSLTFFTSRRAIEQRRKVIADYPVEGCHSEWWLVDAVHLTNYHHGNPAQQNYAVDLFLQMDTGILR